MHTPSIAVFGFARPRPPPVPRDSEALLTILAKLYNEQELVQEMKRLKDKQAARIAAVSAKGKAKADKQLEKEHSKKRAREEKSDYMNAGK